MEIRRCKSVSRYLCHHNIQIALTALHPEEDVCERYLCPVGAAGARPGAALPRRGQEAAQRRPRRHGLGRPARRRSVEGRRLHPRIGGDISLLVTLRKNDAAAV